MSKQFKYGSFVNKVSETVQKWRNTDDMNGANSYSPGSTMNFYMETGGNNYLVTPETYLSFNITFTEVGQTYNEDCNQCTLDYNTDALFYETWLEINNREVERIKNANILCNVLDTIFNGCEYNQSIVQNTAFDATIAVTVPSWTLNVDMADADVTVTQNSLDSTIEYLQTGGVTASAVQVPGDALGVSFLVENADFSGTTLSGTGTGTGTTDQDPVYKIYSTKHENNWIGQSSDLPRQGRPFVQQSVDADGTLTATYQLIYPIKSNFIGKWADEKYFPLAFITKMYYSAMLETAKKAIIDTTFTLADGYNLVTTLNWNYSLSNCRLNYTLSMPKKEVLKAVRDAYLKNAMPDLVWGFKIFNWSQSDTSIPTGSNTGSSRFTIPRGKYDLVYFVLLRSDDFAYENSASLSNFTGGFQNIQLIINGNKNIPNDRIDTGQNAYELYRQLISSNGLTSMNNTNIRLPSTWGYSLTNGSVGANGTLNTIIFVSGGVVATTGQPGAGTINMDEWNAPVTSPNTEANSRQQGCTILSFALNDPLVGEDESYGIELDGNCLELRWKFGSDLAFGAQFYCFARQTKELIIKSHDVDIRS